MARYKLDICAVFDTEKSPEIQMEEARALVHTTCPKTFNLREHGYCSNYYECWSCWYKALEEGVKNGVESVHVERLD